jgi:hypothetical protein
MTTNEGPGVASEAEKSEGTSGAAAASRDGEGTETKKEAQNADPADGGSAPADEGAEAKAGDATAAEGKVGEVGPAEPDTAEPREAEAKAGEEKAENAPAKAPRVTRKAREAVLAAPPVEKQGRGATIGILALVVIVGGVLVSIVFMRKPEATTPSSKAAPEPASDWAVGEKVDVTITLLPTDAEHLECASPTEVAKRHCAFESKETAWSKGPVDDDKTLLRPYATTGRKRLIAAGLWSEPALKGTLPTKRFAVNCTFQIEGKLEKPAVRFKKGTPFKDVKDAWFTGLLSDCSMKK